MADIQTRLAENESTFIVQTNVVLSAGIHRFRINSVSNSLLSTFFVQQGQAEVSYFDFSAGKETEAGARYALGNHPSLQAGQNDRVLISKIHNHVQIEINIITDAKVGLYVSAVGNFPASGDAFENQTADTRSGGVLPAFFDDVQNKYFIGRGYSGVQEIGGAVRPQGLRGAGKVSLTELNSTTWLALPVTPLQNRAMLAIQNDTNKDIKINYNAETVGYIGVLIAKGTERIYQIGDNIVLYGRTKTETALIVTEEIA